MKTFKLHSKTDRRRAGNPLSQPPFLFWKQAPEKNCKSPGTIFQTGISFKSYTHLINMLLSNLP